jgi:hypothetical protein
VHPSCQTLAVTQTVAHYSLPCFPELAEARQLASLAGVRDDLIQVLSYCEVVERQAAHNRRIPAVWDGLTTAAVVAYARCFTKGVRTASHKVLLHSITPELLEAHHYFMNLRDKHVAHSVNSFEENLLTVELQMDGRSPQGVVGVDISSRRVVGVGEYDLTRLRALSEWVLDRVEGLFAAEQSRLLERVRQESLESLLKTRGEPLPAFLTQTSITKRRKNP